MRSRPLSTSMRRTRTFFNVLSPPLPDPPARGGLPWVAVRDSGDDPRGVDSATPSPGLLPDAPGANGGGNSGGTSPGAPPPGEAPGTGPPSRPEGVYTPTAHEGAPARGDGPGSSLGEGCGPGSGEGPHAAVAGWRYSRGHSRDVPEPPWCLTGHARRGRRWGRRRYEPRRLPSWSGPSVRTPDLAGGCLYAHGPRGRPRARRWHRVPPGGGGLPGQWHGAPRFRGGLAVQQGAQPPRHCGSSWRRA